MQTVNARHKLNPDTIVEIPLDWKDTPLWDSYEIIEEPSDPEPEPEESKSRGRKSPFTHHTDTDIVKDAHNGQ